METVESAIIEVYGAPSLWESLVESWKKLPFTTKLFVVASSAVAVIGAGSMGRKQTVVIRVE